MNYEEAKRTLIQYNLWRRDNHIPNAFDLPAPKDIGESIDVAIAAIETVITLTTSNETKNKT